MSHILISFSFKDPDHNENIVEPAYEDIFHINFFSTNTDFSPKETDVEEIHFSYDVRDWDNYYLTNYIFVSRPHYRLEINHKCRFVRSKGIQSKANE